MARTETKHCKTCGRAFQSPLRPGGLSSSTVNCPEHRGRTRREAISAKRAEGASYEDGYRDGLKDGAVRPVKPGFSGYRATFWKRSGVERWRSWTNGYEAGFRAAGGRG